MSGIKGLGNRAIADARMFWDRGVSPRVFMRASRGAGGAGLGEFRRHLVPFARHAQFLKQGEGG